MEGEVKILEGRKKDLIREVREIEAGMRGVGDGSGVGLEERGRWEKGREGVLRGLLGMEVA